MGTKRVGMARVKSLINENVNKLKLKLQEQVDLVHNVTTNHTIAAAQSGNVFFWTHGSAHDITLPSAVAGRHLKFVLKVGSAHANHLVTQSADKVYGKVAVISTTDDKTSVQVLAAGAGVDKIKLHASSATLGGNSGYTIELYCYEDGFWTCEANLVTTNANPGSIAVMAD